MKVCAAASGGAAAAPAKQPFKWGADMKNLAICIGVGAALALCPAPAGVTPKAWNLLAIFTGEKQLGPLFPVSSEKHCLLQLHSCTEFCPSSVPMADRQAVKRSTGQFTIIMLCSQVSL